MIIPKLFAHGGHSHLEQDMGISPISLLVLAGVAITVMALIVGIVTKKNKNMRKTEDPTKVSEKE